MVGREGGKEVGVGVVGREQVRSMMVSVGSLVGEERGAKVVVDLERVTRVLSGNGTSLVSCGGLLSSVLLVEGSTAVTE